MVLSKKILILEDNLRVLSKILDKLSKLEDDQPYDFCLLILTDYTQVQNYINNNPKAEFDIIILDRDCKLGGSFHVLDIEKFGVEKVISISAVIEYNEDAQERGVKKVVYKDFSNLDHFAEKVVREIENMITKNTLKRLTNLFKK